MIKKIGLLMVACSLVLMVAFLTGCGEKEHVKTETKTITETKRTPTGISRLWGEDRITREEKVEVKTMNAPN